MHGRDRGDWNPSCAGADMSKNAHKTIYVIKPEFNSNSQIVFKDNYRAMINGKNVLILTATVTTGLTINKAIEGVQYYGGIIQGISAVFSALENSDQVGIRIKRCSGLPVQRLQKLPVM